MTHTMTHAIGLLWLTTAACSSSLPQRYVIERDLGSYHYRRYQETLEAELPIAGNRGHGHTAAYLRRTPQGVDAVSAFVTVYERPTQLTETLRTELAELPGYELRTETIAGHYAWVLASSSDASFWLWPSGQFVVKLGVPAGKHIPDDVAEPYAALYPSDLDSFGHARKGTSSSGAVPDADDAEGAPKPAQSTGKARGAAQGTLAEAGSSR